MVTTLFAVHLPLPLLLLLSYFLLSHRRSLFCALNCGFSSPPPRWKNDLEALVVADHEGGKARVRERVRARAKARVRAMVRVRAKARVRVS